MLPPVRTCRCPSVSVFRRAQDLRYSRARATALANNKDIEAPHRIANYPATADRGARNLRSETSGAVSQFFEEGESGGQLAGGSDTAMFSIAIGKPTY